MNAEDFFKQMCNENDLDENGNYSLVDIKTFMVEFARLHVEGALTAASQEARLEFTDKYQDKVQVDVESILNAYPLEWIE